jgi:peptide/nickel transport system substrate-binding protein
MAPLLSACGGGSAGSGSPAGTGQAVVPSFTQYPRTETLYTSGTAYSPPDNFNPLDSGSYYTGTMGLLYETLFLYNPSSGKVIPWLASPGSHWTGSTYTIWVRSGVKWTNGSPLTGADVAYSVRLAITNPAVPYSNLAPYIKSVTSNGNTVTVNFTSPRPYTAWLHYLWTGPVLPEAVFSKLSRTEQVTAANFTAGTSPVATGPMTLVSTNPTEACYEDNPNWWAIKQLDLSFHFKYLCDILNSSNSVELSALLNDQLDWSNNFLPGVRALVTTAGDGTFLRTYYPSLPYMLPADTVWLEMNTTRAPMSNLYFRKAVAAAIDPGAIVSDVYSGITQPANPTGLLPNLGPFINAHVVKKYGFTHNTTLAERYLAESGYHGQTISLEVPSGWTDWMSADQIISTELGAIGINVVDLTPASDLRTSDMEDGDYDMMLDNNAGLDSSPWTYFDRVFQLPIPNNDSSLLNVERYTDKVAWGLLQTAATIPTADTMALDGVYAQIETRFLQELPEIPLWYNGAWFQGNATFWDDYPSSVNPYDQYTPVMWDNWLGNMTTVLALAQLRPASA